MEKFQSGIVDANNRETFQEGDWKIQVGKMKRGIRI